MSNKRNDLWNESKAEAFEEELTKALSRDLPIYLKARVIYEVMGMDTKYLIDELISIYEKNQ